MKKFIFNPGFIAAFLILAMVSNPILAKKWIVNVQNYSFTPYNLTHVKAKDTIEWVWQEGTHSTTSTSIPEGADSWDSPITQAEPSFIYVPMVNGTYFYQCTQHANSGMNGTFVVSGASGSDELDDTENLAVFPNPYRDFLTLKLRPGVSPVTTVHIYSAGGNLVRVVDCSKMAGNSFRIPGSSELARGVFFFKFTDASNHVLIRRIIHE
ncbi:MAG: hypothetical protein M0P58_09415 [Bacteroidales bacterium]|jgi:plastocyanin|nr:hypothetical protein [Bacteroidales bacterium]